MGKAKYCKKVKCSSAFDALMNSIIMDFPVGAPERNNELFLRYKEGDESARDELILCNAKLILSYALKQQKTFMNVDLEDLFQMGILGFIRSLDTYEPEKGLLSTYSSPYINAFISRYGKSAEFTIKRPVHLQSLISKYIRLIRKYESKNDPIPSDEELMEILNVSREKLEICKMQAYMIPFSLNYTVTDEPESDILAVVADNGPYSSAYDAVLEEIANREFMVFLKEFLNPLEYFVIYHTIIEKDRTCISIAQEYHITHQAVTLIRKGTLTKLKRKIQSHSYKLDLHDLRQSLDVNFYRLEPTELKPIMRYLWMRDEFTLEERKVYKAIAFSTYLCSLEDISKSLGYSMDELLAIKKRIEDKTTESIRNNLEKYMQFKNSILDEYGIRILNRNFDMIQLPNVEKESLGGKNI